MTAVDMGSSLAMFYNPASMARLEGGHLALGSVQWIADIGYNSGSVAYSLADGQYGTIGINVMAVDYGELEGTIRSENDVGYERTGNFSPSALAVGLGYATSLSDRFSLGGTARYVRQDLGDTVMDGDGTTQSNSVGTPVFDFGVQYQTGYRSLNLGFSVRNFSPSVTYEQESFEAPLLLSIGASFNMMDLAASASDMHSFLLTAEAGHPSLLRRAGSGGRGVPFHEHHLVAGRLRLPDGRAGYQLGRGTQPRRQRPEVRRGLRLYGVRGSRKREPARHSVRFLTDPRYNPLGKHGPRLDPSGKAHVFFEQAQGGRPDLGVNV